MAVRPELVEGRTGIRVSTGSTRTATTDFVPKLALMGPPRAPVSVSPLPRFPRSPRLTALGTRLCSLSPPPLVLVSPLLLVSGSPSPLVRVLPCLLPSAACTRNAHGEPPLRPGKSTQSTTFVVLPSPPRTAYRPRTAEQQLAKYQSLTPFMTPFTALGERSIPRHC